jgi:hypothetical protein
MVMVVLAFLLTDLMGPELTGLVVVASFLLVVRVKGLNAEGAGYRVLEVTAPVLVMVARVCMQRVVLLTPAHMVLVYSDVVEDPPAPVALVFTVHPEELIHSSTRTSVSMVRAETSAPV